jgi:DUF1365 family protein
MQQHDSTGRWRFFAETRWTFTERESYAYPITQQTNKQAAEKMQMFGSTTTAARVSSARS